eukprot:TRINITY_DN18950_c0_g1_i1.p1 TRINITY_DN18950_c0_g1~~TRINITY_DN18950_c0_g1_i1.p1  ORF type:complete len:368 (-),score=49.11 TRINITY_DN18950_c0_g1_i1:286-1254(-)
MAASPAFYTSSSISRISCSRRQHVSCFTDPLQARRRYFTGGIGLAEGLLVGQRQELLKWGVARESSASKVISAQNGDAFGEAPNPKERRPRVQRQSSVRSKVMGYIEKQAGYTWLVGPLLATSVVVLPSIVVPMIDLLQQSYLVGLAASFGIDILFVMAADLFLVLADKAGHHQAVPGGPSPWIGPWEYTGYPKGLPQLENYLAYAGVGIAAFALLVSLLVGKLLVALPIFGPYLVLIFVQLAYERLLSNDRLPSYPLVPILYTVYRFRQLARGMELVAALGGGLLMAFTLKVLLAVWTLYFGMYLTQLPWLYSTWNSNKAT